MNTISNHKQDTTYTTKHITIETIKGKANLLNLNFKIENWIANGFYHSKFNVCFLYT